MCAGLNHLTGYTISSRSVDYYLGFHAFIAFYRGAFQILTSTRRVYSIPCIEYNNPVMGGGCNLHYSPLRICSVALFQLANWTNWNERCTRLFQDNLTKTNQRKILRIKPDHEFHKWTTCNQRSHLGPFHPIHTAPQNYKRRVSETYMKVTL